MALPASGQLSASQINVELNRTSTATFSMNGADERALAGVASGQISFSDFHGKSAAPATTLVLTNRNVVHQVAYANATAGIRFQADGLLRERRGAGYTTVSGQWCDPSVNGSPFEVFVAIGSSNFNVNTSTGTLNVWQSLDVDREHTITRSVVGTQAQRELVCTIREKANHSNSVTANILLYAQRTA